MKKLIILSLLLATSYLLLTTSPTAAASCNPDQKECGNPDGIVWCCNSDETCSTQNYVCTPKTTGQFGAITPRKDVFKYDPSVIGMRQLFSNVIAFFTIAGGVVVLFLLVTGGIAYMTSGGDAKAAGSAQSKITHALIGLAFLVLSTVVFGLISRLLGVDFLKLPWPTAPQ